MADVVQNVIIDFQVNEEALVSGIDRVADIGEAEKKNADEFKKANAEINKQAKILSDLGKSGKASGKDLNDALKAITGTVGKMGAAFRKEFEAGAAEAMREAGVSAEELEAALNEVAGAENNAVESSKSLKAQLREMVQELARMKVAGEDNSEQYRDLSRRAGELKDAIGDANAEVSNFASDTSTFDGLISAVSGVAGGFAVVQGASALFGDESEELQETLLKVNAAMAILQGLQQVQNVLQKESAATTLLMTIRTKAQTAAQAALTFVIGSSTGALKAFRIALAATGVGLLIIGLAKLVEVIGDFNEETEDAEQIANDFAIALENIGARTNDAQAAIRRQTNENIALLEKEGASVRELGNERARGAEKSIEALKDEGVQLSNELVRLAGQQEKGILTQQKYDELVSNNYKATQANIRAVADAESDLKVLRLNNQKAVSDDDKKRAEETAQRAKEASDKARELAKKERAAAFEDFKAGVELELLAAEEGSEEQLALQKRLLNAELQIALEGENLTQNQRKLLIQKFFKDRLELEKDFNKKQTEIFRQNVLSETNAALAAVELTNEQRFFLTEVAIKEQASIEIAAAEGNGSKIIEINAKRDQQIREARLASIRATLEYELALEAAQGGANSRRLEQIAADTEAEKAARLDAVEELTRIESAAIQKRIDALNKERSAGLISQEEYNLRYAQLVDEQAKNFEDAEKKKTDIVKSEEEKRREEIKKAVETSINVASQVVGVLSSIYDAQAEAENQKISAAMARVQELRDAGAITEKEAIIRQKRLEAEEKQAKYRQAQRDKQVAVFNALLAIPSAYLQGLAQGGIPLAIVYGALAAVQAAIVASRKIPKFATGKKGSYEGLGEVGEAGTELIEKDGRMYVADKSSIVWLGKNDKVYNPSETRQMLSARVDKSIMQAQPVSSSINIDYKKMGEELGKHVKTDVYVDGVHAMHKAKQYFEQYINAKRQF